MNKLILGAVTAAKTLKPSEVKENPAKAAGTVVGAALTVAGHPYVAMAAAKGTEKLVDRAMPAIKDRTAHFKESIGLSRGDSTEAPPIE